MCDDKKLYVEGKVRRPACCTLARSVSQYVAVSLVAVAALAWQEQGPGESLSDFLVQFDALRRPRPALPDLIHFANHGEQHLAVVVMVPGIIAVAVVAAAKTALDHVVPERERQDQIAVAAARSLRAMRFVLVQRKRGTDIKGVPLDGDGRPAAHGRVGAQNDPVPENLHRAPANAASSSFG